MKRFKGIRATGQIAAPAAIAAVALGWLGGNPPALAQDEGPVNVDVSRCVDIESRDERLACFEAQVDRELESRGPGAQAEPPSRAAESEVARPAAAGDSGQGAQSPPASPPEPATREQRARERAAERARETEEQEEFAGTISTIREREPSTLLITLENGQVWLQTHPKRYFLRPGDKVRIYSTKWGDSYRLSSETAGGFIVVERVR